MSSPTPPSAARRSRSPCPSFTPPRSNSSAERKICICDWGQRCCEFKTFFKKHPGHPYSGKAFDYTFSKSCDFQNFWAAATRYFHIPAEQQQQFISAAAATNDNPKKKERFRIARHHFPVALLQYFNAAGGMKYQPLSREILEQTGCYKHVNPPPSLDIIFHYNSSLGGGISARASKRMKGERHYRVVPCMSRDQVSSIAAQLQHQGQATARLDIEQVRVRFCTAAEWQDIILQKDRAIASLKSRVEELEGILKEKEERIGQLCRRRKANNDVIRRRSSSLEVIGEELSEQEKTLFYI